MVRRMEFMLIDTGRAHGCRSGGTSILRKETQSARRDSDPRLAGSESRTSLQKKPAFNGGPVFIEKYFYLTR